MTSDNRFREYIPERPLIGIGIGFGFFMFRHQQMFEALVMAGDECF